MDYEKTGRLIRKNRTALGLTQVQLSEAVAVTPQAVSLWENGKRFPDAPAQLMLFKVLGLNPVELLTGLEMFNKDLKTGIRSHLDQIDEKVFVAGMAHDVIVNENSVCDVVDLNGLAFYGYLLPVTHFTSLLYQCPEIILHSTEKEAKMLSV